ncbi:carbohydrate ABC transporter permease [Faecalicatena contorta]|uniref:Carbohydrate ABC transporter membrane protein 1, CUT1 family n=1 Tax=Faecalicatena contorta TaxID=39482 RepID=A0A315ZYF9_9FIRM|nr:sugar ABC transporter permease [Faecalicatena contorta]PWJ50716.1 carbohydrate ABC transporter membrane protein 1 (CUT1 family) [Faecalicatena contorta]SUQ13284.1 carbohydrate ABC transporter membrane protein 1, CUT1 family [Faecalicatena contorta]
MEKRRRYEGYFFILPGLLYVLLVLGYPLVYNFVLSLKNINVKNFNAGTATFVGLQNYQELFSHDVFLLVMKNTFVFTIFSLIFQFIIGFLFAMYFQKKSTLSGPMRGLILISYMIPTSVAGLLGKNIFAIDGGVVNDLLLKVGLIDKPIDWLISSGTAMFAVIAINCWIGIPYNMLLMTSGLSNISADVYESASIDGANVFQKFFFITLPLVKPAMLAVLMLGFIYTFKAFDLMFIMTKGGPMNATDTMGTYAYQLSFQKFEFSKGAAAAIILFLCLFIVGVFYLRLISKEED